MKYLIAADASWNAGHEHPHGHRDVNETKTQSFAHQFNAENVHVARVKAVKLLFTFTKSLPGEHKGSLSWNSEPEVNVTFGRVLAL